MVKLSEWLKGITFGLFAIILFYFYWDNIFMNMLDFIGNFDIVGVTETTSIAILKTMTWVSFVILFVTSVPLYMFYSITRGSKNEGDTHPLEILKGIAIWLISAPIGLIIYVIIASMVSALTSATSGLIVDPGDLAGNFSWLIGLIAIIGVNVMPYYYILKGYGQLGVTNET